MSSQSAPTRDRLLEVREQLKDVVYGKNLLEKKRDALLRNIEEDRRRFYEFENRFRAQCSQIAVVYTLVRMYEGEAIVRLLKPDSHFVSVVVEQHTLMGCIYPEFFPKEESPSISGISYDPVLASLYVDDLVKLLEETKVLIWPYINLKSRITSLERELKKTMLKINTLQYTVLPEFKNEIVKIREVLSERERQERYAIKKLTRKKKGI